MLAWDLMTAADSSALPLPRKLCDNTELEHPHFIQNFTVRGCLTSARARYSLLKPLSEALGHQVYSAPTTRASARCVGALYTLRPSATISGFDNLYSMPTHLADTLSL